MILIYLFFLRLLVFLRRVRLCETFCALYNKNGNKAVFKAPITPDPLFLLLFLLRRVLRRPPRCLLLRLLLLAIIYYNKKEIIDQLDLNKDLLRNNKIKIPKINKKLIKTKIIDKNIYG